MKKLLVSTSLVLVLLVTFVNLASAATGGVTNPQALKDLAAVRQVTEKYQDVEQAYLDEFVATPECVVVDGVGGMGYHLVNFSRLMDGEIELLEPEVLLYDGNMKLVGVEYMLPIGPPDAPVPNPAPPAPVLFGVSFGDPMLGHGPGMPPHFDLHVWIWRGNPAGIFTPLNPNVSC